jgi:DNA mismatch repair protein MutS2
MISEKTINLLELPKVLEQLTKYTSFSTGAELVRELRPSTDLEEARVWQQETAEARALFESKQNLSMGGVSDVRDISLSAQRGVVIEASRLLDIRSTLRRAGLLARTLTRGRTQYPLLAEVASEIQDLPGLQDAISTAIDDNGEVKDTASPRLAIIRRDMKIAFDKLQQKLNRIISTPTKSIYLQEALITMRNGRYVVPLKADHKGKIPGIVHDSSSSGMTLFIEPMETVELNNKWRELQIDEEKEIWRILSALTAQVGEHAEDVCRTVEVLGYIDLVFARAHYANEIKAVEPLLVAFRRKGENHPGSTITLKGARHPLLRGNVVPIDLEFDDNTWILVVTGPNTGGKTVSLKTVGLMTLMAQCGLHLPVEEAELSVFEGIHADIGDEQSIEQSLSTFSAHMTNTINILEGCTDRSLVILDEVGAGTDPTEGSALARAILSYLRDRQVTTMVSTHHPELKIYSVETPGVRNASVEFDLETLAPTYRLIVGLPGRSNALAIARRLGLGDEIIEAARAMVATEDLIADDLLDEIHRTRETIRRQQEESERLRHELQEQRDVLQARLDKIEDERRDIINAARRNAEQELDDVRKEIKRLRRDMQTAGVPLEQIRQVEQAAAKASAEVNKPVQNVTETVDRSSEWRPRVGDTVWLETLNAEGVVTEMDTTEAVVQVGSLRVRARLNELQKRSSSQKRTMQRGHVRKYEDTEFIPPRGKSPGMELDLRGLRVEGALEKLIAFIEAAYSAGLPFARIIHGKGTGALRKAIREQLEGHELVSKIETGHPNEGGDGVTVIHMVPIA